MEKEQKQELGWRVSVLPIPAFHHCEIYNYVLQVHSIQWNAGMGNTDTLLVSVLFLSLHLKYFRIKFLLLVCIVFMRMHTKPYPHPVKAKPHPHRRRRRDLKCWLCLLWSVPFLPSPEVLNSC